MRVVVTGGAGFIGSTFLNLFVQEQPQHTFLNLDKLTYAGNLQSLADIQDRPNYHFQQLDLADADATTQAIHDFNPDGVFHFAAESHVDRSIVSPGDFIQSNIVGTFNLLQACRTLWGTNTDQKLFHHISTDEVFGELGDDGLFHEETAYHPNSPYSASKASSDHIVRAYNHTYGLPVIVTNCSNNYGPRQFPEKLIPLMILNAVEGQPLPIYGEGLNVRDWLYVEDHCRAINLVAHEGTVGETYCIGGNNEIKNIDVVHAIIREVAHQTGKPEEEILKQITYVKDRPGHDFRYAIDTTKIKNELSWTPSESFESGLSKTVAWYLNNPTWIEGVRTGSYRDWINSNYGARA